MRARFRKSMRRKLLSLEKELLQSLEAQQDEYDELTYADRTEETEDAAVRNEERTLSALLHHEERRLTRVRSALGRLVAGHYGTCADCGNPIGEERLKAQPDTIFCYGCAKKRQGNIRSPHLS